MAHAFQKKDGDNNEPNVSEDFNSHATTKAITTQSEVPIDDSKSPLIPRKYNHDETIELQSYATQFETKARQITGTHHIGKGLGPCQAKLLPALIATAFCVISIGESMNKDSALDQLNWGICITAIA